MQRRRFLDRAVAAGGVGVATVATPASYKSAFESACAEQTMKMLARYDAANPAALKNLIAGGAKVAYFPRDVMDAAFKASQEFWTELSAKNLDFAKIFPSWQQFQQDQAGWFRVAESALDGYTFNAVTRR